MTKPAPKPAPAPAAPRSLVTKASSNNASNQAIEDLSNQLMDMRLNLEGLEKERDFYFSKLRDIEILCQEADESESSAIITKILDILYATEVSENEMLQSQSSAKFSIVNMMNGLLSYLKLIERTKPQISAIDIWLITVIRIKTYSHRSMRERMVVDFEVFRCTPKLIHTCLITFFPFVGWIRSTGWVGARRGRVLNSSAEQYHFSFTIFKPEQKKKKQMLIMNTAKLHVEER